MKIVPTVLGLLVSVATAATMTLAPASVSAAGTAVFSVAPTGGTYTTGSTFVVTVSEDSGVNDVDSARAELTYNASTLEVVGFSTAANPFTTCLTPASAAAGKISTGDCTLLGGKKQGKQTLATVTFKALANSGSSSVAFAATSKLVANGVDLSWTQVGATYAFAAPVAGGKGADAPAPTTPAKAPAKAPTTPSKAVATTPVATTGAVEGDATKAPEAPATETKKDDTKKADTKNTDAKSNGSQGWLWLVVIIAGVAGYVAARKLRSTPAAKAAPVVAAPVVKAKPATKTKKAAPVTSAKKVQTKPAQQSKKTRK